MLLSIASLNVNGLRGNLKRKTTFYFLKQKKYDIILLQETHSTSADENLWVCEWGGKVFFYHGEKHTNGVAMLFKHTLQFLVHANFVDSPGRFLLLEIQV